jgi:parallel beta-helix repeat protein
VTHRRIVTTRTLITIIATGTIALGMAAAPAHAATISPVPGTDLSALISSYPSGTTFQLGTGAYPVTKSIHMRSGDSLIGQGAGTTILDGGNSSFDGILTTNDTSVHISALTLRDFHDGVIAGPGSVIDSVESGPNAENGIQVIGDSSTVQNCDAHDNGRFGIYVNGASNVQVLDNEVVQNHTSTAWSNGYAGGLKVMNFATGVLVQGNTVSETNGNGIWTDNSAKGTQIISNTVLGSTAEAIRLEKSYNTVVSGNTADSGIDSLDSSGGLIEGNTVSSPGLTCPLRLAGNGAKNSSGVEYANVNNTAQGNGITLATGQRAGVFRTAGTSSGNSFVANTYHAPSLTSRWFAWWSGGKRTYVDWSTWTTGYQQDVTGGFVGPTA